jgi:hypothetical protein
MKNYKILKELKPCSVEEWAKKQIEWLIETKETYINQDKDKATKIDLNPYGYRLMMLAARRVPFKMDKDTMVICATQVDRIAIAVMIVHILWTITKLTQNKKVLPAHAQTLFLSNISDEQWHQAWEEQKYWNPETKSLENMLDNDDLKKSLMED